MRVACLLLATACSEALTPSLMMRPALPHARSVTLVASLEGAASMESAASVEVEASDASASTPWLQRLNKVSNVASILCAIDCTVFPVLLTLLPILNLGSSGRFEVRRAGPRHRTHPDSQRDIPDAERTGTQFQPQFQP